MNESIDISQKSDEELVVLTLKQQDNFSYLVNRYQDKLSRYIYRLSGLSEEEIEDLLQNIFIKAYLNLNDFDGSLKFSSWLYRIAHNETIDNHRRHQARPKLLDLDISSDSLREIADDNSIVVDYEEQEIRISIEKAMAVLDPKLREVLILKFIEERDYHEISDIIRKPMGTVASRINKAKKALKKIMLQTNQFQTYGK